MPPNKLARRPIPGLAGTEAPIAPLISRLELADPPPEPFIICILLLIFFVGVPLVLGDIK